MTKRVLFVLAAVVLVAAGLFVRSTSAKTAKTKADQVVRQDKAGADTTDALIELKSYVSTHMGATVTYKLDGSYARAQAASAAATAAAAAASAATGRIYADAQKACGGKSDSVTQARCNQAYLSKHLTAAPPPSPVVAPKASDYQRTLKAPFWTPDLAGALLLGAAAAFGFSIVLSIRRRY